MKHINRFNDFLNEAEEVKKHFYDLWKELYNEDFISSYPKAAKILKNRPKNIDRKEIKRIWEETYEKDFEKEYPEIWNMME